MESYRPLGCLLWTAILLATYFPASYAQLENTAQPEVTILQGTLRGTTLTTRHGRNVFAFMGIPFAQPPTGNRRFANPVPADNWNGTLDASADANTCPQIRLNVVVGDEDCLYISVYTSQLPEDTSSSRLPVMVYIHGGAFQSGSQRSDGPGSPEYLLDADIVLVGISYRLGPLGFLSTGDGVASGNWGLKDQVLGLKWIQDNVQYFGGDPGQVTIFGESAGSICTHLLTLSNATVGLFHRYITESGSALAPWGYRPRAAYSSRAFELGKFVGCDNDTSVSLINCLRTLDFADIIDTAGEFFVWESIPRMVFGPTDEPADVEGAVLTDSPSNLVAAGGIRDLPWISGVSRDEGLFYSTALYEDEDMLLDLVDKFDTILPVLLFWTYQADSGAAWTRAVKSYYFNNDLTSNRTVLLKNLTTLFGDSQFFYPARSALQQHHAFAVNPQYFYTLNYRGTYSHTYNYGSGTMVNYGVCHGDDLIYLFPPDWKYVDLNVTMSETDSEISETIIQLWTSFAINGTPTVQALGSGLVWEPYSSQDAYLRIGNESDPTLEIQYSFFQERMEFWANIDAYDSGSATWSSDLLLLVVVAGLKFILCAAVGYELE